MKKIAPITSPAPAGSRVVGIQHRVKATADGQARPTIVHIRLPDGSSDEYPLDTVEHELDWLYGRFPRAWRKAVPGEDLTAFAEWHVQRDLKTKEPVKVPASYDGFREGDLVGMVLGGSGDYFAFALAKRAELIGAAVRRIAPFKLDEARGAGKKDDDAALFALLAAEKPDLFEEAKPLGLAVSRLRVSVRLWLDSMQARIAAGNRFDSAYVGRFFLDVGEMPLVQSLTKLADEAKAKDPGLVALEREEAQKLRQVQKDLGLCQIWTDLFDPIEGVGPSIGARIISGVITVTRFGTAPKFRKYCGAHCLDDGSFARRKNGVVANWSGEIRQALWLLGDQFNRRPQSVWGTRLLENKGMYQRKHPFPVLRTKDGTTYELDPARTEKVKSGWKVPAEGGETVVSGKLSYQPAHILKMALWRTITEFVDWLYDAWWAIEEGKKAPEPKDWLDTKENRGTAVFKVKEEKPKTGAKKSVEEEVRVAA